MSIKELFSFSGSYGRIRFLLISCLIFFTVLILNYYIYLPHLTSKSNSINLQYLLTYIIIIPIISWIQIAILIKRLNDINLNRHWTFIISIIANNIIGIVSIFALAAIPSKYFNRKDSSENPSRSLYIISYFYTLAIVATLLFTIQPFKETHYYNKITQKEIPKAESTFTKDLDNFLKE